MKKAFEKLLRHLFFEKFPIYLDVRVREDSGLGYVRYTPSGFVDSPRNKCYEVILTILDEDSEQVDFEEVSKFVRNLAKYMDAEICGVYNNSVSREEWEEMKLNKDD